MKTNRKITWHATKKGSEKSTGKGRINIGSTRAKIIELTLNKVFEFLTRIG